MQVSPAATEVARRHWACAAGDTGTVEEVAATAERTCTQLQAGLARWVGTEGYRALLHRALLLARAEHPALGSLSCHGGDRPVTTGAARAHSAAEVATGMVALVAALVELLGRIVGEEMAVELVNQAVGSAPVAKGKSKTRPRAGANLRRQH